MNCLRIPDFVRIITEDDSALMENKENVFEYKDIQVEFTVKDSLDIFLTALQSEVKFIGCWII